MRSGNRQSGSQKNDQPQAYGTPQALCDDARLPRERKLALLRQWEYDLRAMQVASEENMQTEPGAGAGASAEQLSEVRRCLQALGDKPDEHAQSTKHGGYRDH